MTGCSWSRSDQNHLIIKALEKFCSLFKFWQIAGGVEAGGTLSRNSGVERVLGDEHQDKQVTISQQLVANMQMTRDLKSRERP